MNNERWTQYAFRATIGTLIAMGIAGGIVLFVRVGVAETKLSHHDTMRDELEKDIDKNTTDIEVQDDSIHSIEKVLVGQTIRIENIDENVRAILRKMDNE